MYSGRLKLHGENHQETIWSAGYLANSLYRTRRFDEGKALLHKVIPVARPGGWSDGRARESRARAGFSRKLKTLHRELAAHVWMRARTEDWGDSVEKILTDLHPHYCQ